MKPLQGIRVLDVSTVIAGPTCCQILGDFGADVIKVEQPGTGDPLRGHGAAVNGTSLWWKVLGRNKRSVGIDLRTPEGAGLLRQLAAGADILVESFRPGTLARWGLGAAELREDNPGLVIVRVSGFGQSGPYAARPGFGTLAEAMSGFADLTGNADDPPTLPAFGLADSICGIAASTATLLALRHREATGVGQDVDLSLLEPMLAVVGPGPTTYDVLGVVDTRHGNRSTNNAPRNTYLTRDDRWVAVSASTSNIARRVLTLVGQATVAEQPWFATSRGRAAHADEIDRLVGAWIAVHPLAEVLTAFEAAGAAIAPVYSARDIVEDPHVRETGMLVRVADPVDGPMLMPNVMWRMSRTPGAVEFAGRPLGSDTDAILTGELGHPPDAVTRWRASAVVA
jgi:crotonobetainyl-CoA:carnitine CoA-transferase CaiB-like acyl-CoA transferase